MKKKLVFIIAAIAVLLLGFGLYSQNQKPVTNENLKNIHVVIKTENIILDETFQTEKSDLASFLVELEENKKIELEYEESDYGMYITAMGKDEEIAQDPIAGKYWVYNSSNNKVCKESGMCPAASGLALEDGDEFIFELVKFS